MKTVTTRVESDTYDEIEELAAERDVSKSEVARQLIEKGREYDDLENERDRLERKLTAVNRRESEVTELVEYVEEEKSYRKASLTQRLKWWVTGMPDDDVG